MDKNQFKIKTFKRKPGDIIDRVQENGTSIKCRITHISYRYNHGDGFEGVATFEPVEPFNGKSNHRPLL